MIQSKNDLREYILADNRYFAPRSLKYKMIVHFAKYQTMILSRYLLYLRKQEYYINTAGGNRLKGLIGLWYERKKNILGNYLGIDIGPNCVEKGCYIYHPSIIVNYHASVGEYCKFHGNNCIGNNGKSIHAPRIGNNVDIGFGAVIIGNITIADDVIIGANAVITKSILKSGSVVVGNPGKVIV